MHVKGEINCSVVVVAGVVFDAALFCRFKCEKKGARIIRMDSGPWTLEQLVHFNVTSLFNRCDVNVFLISII